MNFKKNKFLRLVPSLVGYLAVLSIFIVLIYIALGKSLHFALFGDDWFMFYVINKTYGPGNLFSYLSLKGYSQPWGVMNLCLIIIRHFFEYSSYGYFLVSMILRVLASFAGYVFLKQFIKSKMLGFIGSLFILVGYGGIESSNYVLHMNVYLVILFLFISLSFLIGSFKGGLWKFILACFFFAVSLAVNPLRSHGLLPFLLIFDIVYGLSIFKSIFKSLIFRELSLIISALVVYKLGFFGSVHTSIINMPMILQMINAGNFTFISNFATNLGKAFLPDIYPFNLGMIISIFGINWYKGVVVASFLVESLAFLLLAGMTRQKSKNLLVALGILFFCFLLVAFILRAFPRDVGQFLILINTFIGIFFFTFLLWSVYLLFISKKKERGVHWVGVIAGPALILTSLIVPLLINPGAVFGSENRYYTLALGGVAITFASLLKIIIENKRIAIYLVVLLSLLLVFNINSDRKYLSDLYPVRNQEITDFMWSRIFEYMPKDSYPDKLLLFYFDDKDNPGLAFNTILFGFPPRMALEYKISDRGKIPAFTTIYDEVISVVTDGKAFLRLGYPQKKIDVDQVVAFKFTKGGDLIDVTEVVQKDIVTKINIHD